MQQGSIWRPINIILVIGLCAWAIAAKGLKPGMDLAGGFVLTYDVQVPEGVDAPSAVDQIIEVQRKRVDPTGTRNLVFRRQGANRLEIQAALAPAEVRELREKYTHAFDAIKEGNVTRFELEASLRKPPAERQADFDKLAGGDPVRTSLLKKLAETHDAMEAARKPYLDAVKEADKAKETLDKLPADAPAEQRTQVQNFLKEREAERTAKTKAYNDARSRFEPGINAVLATNLDALEVERVLHLPNKTDAKSGINPREVALKQLIDEHPERKKEIQEVVAAWDAYAAKRGPLDDPEDLIALLRGSGVLEFRIAPPPSPNLETYREQLRTKGPHGGSDKNYLWFPIDDVTTFADTEAERQMVQDDAAGYFRSRNLVGERYGDKFYLLMSNQRGERLSPEEEHWKLDRAGRDIDEQGFPAIAFQLNTVGGQLLGELTQNNIGQQMAIVLDGRAISSARINSRIDSRGIITKGRGGYSEREMNYMIRTLNAGSLKATLADRPSSIKFFQAEAGADNLERGKEAFILVAIVVAVFLIGYYFFWGVVATLALVGNIVIILGVMALLESTFTMAGIAGVVLTIGMAVDANVLIFERIREEMQRGADIKTAVRLGFDKAMSAILDSNVTTLITCLILGYFATADVRGFAVTLGIGLVANVFTAVYCSRWMIDAWIKLRNPTSAPMLPTKVAAIQRFLSPNIDWMGKRKIFYAFSAIVIVIGLGVLFARGANMFDIEFRSGTQVGFKLAPGKQLELEAARDLLRKEAEKRNMPELAPPVASLTPVGKITLNHEASEFSVSVLNENKEQVSDAIKSAFSAYLSTERVIHFKGDGAHQAAPAEGAEPAPDVTKRIPDFAHIIRSEDLGDSIGRPSTVKVNDYIGGVAFVLDDLNPAATVGELTARIKRARQGIAGEQLGNREFQVIGLDQAPSGPGSEPAYTSVAIVVTDRLTNYADDPASFATDLRGLAGTEWNLIHGALLKDSSLDSVSSFSSQVSATMQRQATVALILSMLAIAVYIWFRFGDLRFGTSAIIGLLHDVAVALGFVAIAGILYDSPVGPLLGLSDFKINLTMIAAILTIVGYSINDKIVVFDRIRELRGRLATVSPQIINDAINQTISRTMLTGGTTLIALLILYFLGGEAVKGFAYALFIGIVFGTYSSIAIASPLLLLGGGKTPAPAPADNKTAVVTAKAAPTKA